MYVNWSADDLAEVPPGVFTVTSTVPVPAGEETVTCVGGEVDVMVAAAVPKRTSDTFVKFVPVTVTGVPPPGRPLLGETCVTVGSWA